MPKKTFFKIYDPIKHTRGVFRLGRSTNDVGDLFQQTALSIPNISYHPPNGQNELLWEALFQTAVPNHTSLSLSLSRASPWSQLRGPLFAIFALTLDPPPLSSSPPPLSLFYTLQTLDLAAAARFPN